jgi:hypothetical protein
MEAGVWIGTKGRFNPLQQFEQRILSLDGDVLTIRGGAGEAVSWSLSDVEFGFPLSMSGAGFVMTVGGVRSFVWFYDPFAGRSTLLTEGDKDAAAIEGAKSWFAGRKAAKPWLKALRSTARRTASVPTPASTEG